MNSLVPACGNITSAVYFYQCLSGLSVRLTPILYKYGPPSSHLLANESPLNSNYSFACLLSFIIPFTSFSLLVNHGKKQKDSAPIFTTGAGVPVKCTFASERVGNHGPLLLQDSYLQEVLATFNREKIPERIVHANGVGAYGVFEVTEDVTKYTSAKFLQLGTTSKAYVRLSTVADEKGSADTVRDIRGKLRVELIIKKMRTNSCRFLRPFFTRMRGTATLL